MMDFSSQTRLKLRIAVTPFMTAGSLETNPQHHRVVGVKRDVGNASGPVILRQFLLLLPLDSTFSDLKSLTISQYDKLYRSQPNYLPLKRVILFKDANQCDLDWDYLVGDICSSNELVYAMVEVDESNKNKKVKISNEKEPTIATAAINKPPAAVSEPPKSPKKQQPTPPQQASKPQNQEKKVPEFKPTPIKPPTAKSTTLEAKDTVVEVKSKPVEAKKPVEVKKPVQSKKPKEPEMLKEESKDIKEIKEVKSVTTESFEVVNVNTDKADKADMEEESVPVVTEVNPNVTAKTDTSAETADASDLPLSTNVPESIITPGPTPLPRSIFIPRKSPTNSNDPTSSSDEEEDSVLNNFDAANLFGGPVIASEPRRSDPFILFAAGSSSSDDEDDNFEIVEAPVKCSSIVSLQAAPSSELDHQESAASSSSENEEANAETDLLPQSVTLRRLSSVSPIPEPSEIPSLDELKESLVRAPTPSQIQKPKKQKNHNNPHFYNNNNNNNKRGRPAKKQVNGRPKAN